MTEYSAKYFDGLSSQVHVIQYGLEDDRLVLKLAGNDSDWLFKDILIIERPHDNRPAVLSYQSTPNARLIINDLRIYQRIIVHIPPKNIQVAHVQHPWRLLFLAIILIFALLVFAVWGVPYYAPWVANKIPHEWDDHLGRWAVSSLTKQHKVCVNPQGLKALEKMKNRLIHNQNFQHEFDIKVFNIRYPNAFTTPGYHILMTEGLLKHVDSPNEFAGVLAHEMAHAIEHHPTAGLISSLGINIIITAAFGSSPEYGVKLLELSNSRKFEAEADRIGVQILNNANINADGLAKFFDSLVEKQGDIEEYVKYISTHPTSRDRSDTIKKLNKVDNNQSILTDSEWQDLKGICQKMEPLKF